MLKNFFIMFKHKTFSFQQTVILFFCFLMFFICYEFFFDLVEAKRANSTWSSWLFPSKTVVPKPEHIHGIFCEKKACYFPPGTFIHGNYCAYGNFVTRKDGPYFDVPKSRIGFFPDTVLDFDDGLSDLFYDFPLFFKCLFIGEGFWVSLFFFINMCFNFNLIWFFYKKLKTFIRNPFVFANFSLVHFVIQIYIFIYLTIAFLIIKSPIYFLDLIDRYPDEWAFALICTIVLFYADLIQGYNRLDLKSSWASKTPFFFFEGNHLEFIFALGFCFISITLFLDLLSLL